MGGGVCTDGKIGDKSAEEERENSEMGQQENGNSILQKLDTVFVQLQLKLKKRALAQFDKKRYTVFIR